MNSSPTTDKDDEMFQTKRDKLEALENEANLKVHERFTKHKNKLILTEDKYYQRKHQKEKNKQEQIKKLQDKRDEKIRIREAKELKKEQDKLDRIKWLADNKMPAQNNITRPRPMTVCGIIWEMIDEIAEEKEAVPNSKDVLDKAEELGFKLSTVRTQYSRWRKFWNVVRVSKMNTSTNSNDANISQTAIT